MKKCQIRVKGSIRKEGVAGEWGRRVGTWKRRNGFGGEEGNGVGKRRGGKKRW